MSLYAQNPIANGVSYKRASSIIISNNLSPSLPVVTYSEEMVVLSDGVPIFSKPDGMVTGSVNLAEVIQLRDPATGELTGQVLPVSTLYVALYSDYVNRALQRDAAQQAALAQQLNATTVTVATEAPVSSVE